MGYFKTTVRAGATIEVTKSYTKRIGVKIKKDREKPTAEEMEKVNQMNAERTLRLKINANFGVDDPFITLTYRKDERPTPKQAKKNIKKVIDSLRKEFKKLGADLKYINVTEYKNKAIHHHLLINHIEGQDVSKMVRRLWKFGRPDFKYLDDTGQYKDLAAYLIKETSKTYKENDGGHKQRYSCSRNLTMPTPKTEIIKKAQRWAADPKPIKGYYIDKDTVYNGIDPFTGMNDAILSEPNSFGEIKIDKMLQKVRIDPCDAIIDAHKLAMGVEVEEITTDQSIEAYLKMFEKAGVKED